MAAPDTLTPTAPVPRSARPQAPRVARIFGYEAAERFAFYGMLTVLTALVTTRITPAATEAQAPSYLGWLAAAVFGCAFLGAIAAESFLGRFRTVIIGSIIACAGYGILALLPAQLSLLLAGLALVALGTGAVKPCIAAHLGDQFEPANQDLLPRTFGWFYLVIHGSALVAAALSQQLAANPQNGLRWALLLPLIALLGGTLLLWSGRSKFVAAPAFGRGFRDELFSRETGAAVARLFGIYLFVALFWVVWQKGAAEAWVRQAAAMDLRLFQVELLPVQLTAANLIFILLFVPLLSYVVYPFAGRFVAVTPLRKIGAGLFLTGVSFLIAALLQQAIDRGGQPAVAWQLVAWAFLTLGEVMVIVTALELSYTWAPRKIKSIVMCLWLLTFGTRELVAGATGFIRGAEGAARMSDLNYYIFLAFLMGVVTILFAVVAKFCLPKTYLQSQEVPVVPSEAVAPPPEDETHA